jgi:hypothetical protein
VVKVTANGRVQKVLQISLIGAAMAGW